MAEIIDGNTIDMVKENLKKLQEIYPDAFTEGKVDPQKLLLLLGEDVDSSNEKYSFTWKGKNDCIRLAQSPSKGTLLPCKEESVDWDTTKNLYIEGDNLEVLKLLQKSYLGKIDFIYIDPPYNTGSDFIYEDDFVDNIANYKQITGQANKSNAESAGRYHTNWLNMIYPRLKIARTLLTNDGVIFISIDDNEVVNLKKICDEIFGENNFVANLVWQKKTGASDAVNIATITENVLVYAKSISSLQLRRNTDAHDDNRYRYKDEYFDKRGPFYYDNLDRGTLGYHESLDYGVLTPDGTLAYPNGRTEQFNDGWRWKWSKDKLQWGLENGFIELQKAPNKSCGWGVYYKIYLNVDNEGNIIERSSPYKNLIQNILNTHAANESKKLMGNANIFSNPKPSELIKFLISLMNKPNSVVLDFFSGSATTAHAVMQLNAEDGGNRKFILVQLPEICGEKTDAYNAGYKNICEIGKERIRRAGKKIKEELQSMGKERKIEGYTLLRSGYGGSYQYAQWKNIETGEIKTESRDVHEPNDFYKYYPDELDTGFRVFKLDSSNLTKWDNSPTDDPNEVAKRINDSLFYLQPDRTELDFVYEIMLKLGMPLSNNVEISTIDDKKVYGVKDGAYSILICLEYYVNFELVEKLAESEYEVLIFADRCFADANMLINTEEILKKKGKTLKLF